MALLDVNLGGELVFPIAKILDGMRCLGVAVSTEEDSKTSRALRRARAKAAFPGFPGRV